MICPELAQLQNGPLDKEDKDEEEPKNRKKDRKAPIEGSGSIELNSYRNPKTWKKSITNFFRNQLRSTRSNDGDRPSDSKEKFEEKEVSPEQKWQSLGKMFRRQSLAEHWNKSPSQTGESSSQSKRLGVKKVLSSYFGKPSKMIATDEK